MPVKDYYSTLGVAKSASQDEIKKAYRALSRKYHPDMRPNDKEAVQRFREVQEAFEILGDPAKREQYDRFGVAGGSGGGARTAQPVDLNDFFGGGFDFGSFFGGEPRGGGQRTGRPRKGEDVQLSIEIPFQLACEGGTHDLFLNREGRDEQIAVKIPAGVESGSTIRLAGEGEGGRGGGHPGDLLLRVNVVDHTLFRRDGNNLLIDVPITVTEAIVGAKVDVPTLSDGIYQLTIPPGTSSGTKLRLRGKGVVDRQSRVRGDQLCVMKIVVHPTPSQALQSLAKQMTEAQPHNPRAGLW